MSGGSLSSFNLQQLRTSFLLNLRLFLKDDTISDVVLNRYKVYLYDMYSKVTLYGGYHKVSAENLWYNIALELGVCTALQRNQRMTKTMETKLGLPLVQRCYELYLLDYEQCHHFPATVTSLDHVPSEQFERLCQEKPAVIASIPRSDGTNGISNRGTTCSVCGQLGDYNNVKTVILQCMQCGDRWHPHCHEPPIAIHQLQSILQQDNAQWTCTSCTIQKTAKFGYHTSGHRYSLKEYQLRAKQLSLCALSVLIDFDEFLEFFRFIKS